MEVLRRGRLQKVPQATTMSCYSLGQAFSHVLQYPSGNPIMQTTRWPTWPSLCISFVLLAVPVISVVPPIASVVFLAVSSANPMVTLVASAADRGLKTPLRGIAAMGDTAFHHQKNNGIPDNIGDNSALPVGVFDVAVINVTWAQLEPVQGQIGTLAIDEALEWVRAYNARNSTTPLALRLRVWAGSDAPAWAKGTGGSPITVQERDRTITVGRFWSNPYREAWRQLQAFLAKRYDPEPLIHEITMTSCTSISSEPFVLPVDQVSIGNLRSAGFTDQAYQNCLIEAAMDYAPWNTTRVEYPINPLRRIDSGELVVDWDFSIVVMNMWRQKMGERGVLSNYDLKSPLGARVVPIYDHMKELGGIIELQLFAPKNLDLDASVAYGIALGATVIELWNVVIPDVPREKLLQWSNQLKAN